MTSSAVAFIDPPVAKRHIGVLGVALLILLIAAAILSYLDRLAISTLGPLLKQVFSLDNLKWGWVNSSFSLVYIFTSLFGGWWVDRVGVRKGLLISIAIWGLAAMGHSFATGFLSLCFWRMMLALGEGPGMAAMVKGTRRLMPPRWRDFGNGLMNAGWAIGALIAPLVVDPISRRHGWQGAFLFTGGLCFVWIPLWALLSWRRGATLGPQPIDFIAGSDERPRRLNYRSYALWATIVALFFTVPPTVFVNTFLPVFFHDSRGLSQQQYARLYWQPFLGTDLGQILGGLLVYALLRRSWRYLSARRIVMKVGFVGAVSLLGVNFRPDVRGTMWCINLSRFFFQIGYTALVAYGIESVGEGQTALMAGLMNATFSACNLVVNPLIGKMADHYHGFDQVIVLIAMMPLVGLAAWLVLSRLHAKTEQRRRESVYQ
jgi:ACS family hexuronate transporter-like MFS transporter